MSSSSSAAVETCIAFAAGTALGAAALYYYTKQSRQALSQPNESDSIYENGLVDGVTHSAIGGSLNPDISVANFEEDPILSEHLTRNVQFFGLENQKKISNSFVVVVGLGGVGSHAAHLLLRSGVGKLRLVDFDQVTLSSLNRHCLATRADVGIPKATCLVNHFKEILPEADLEAMISLYDDSTEDQVLAGNPDFVLDAIDNIDTKVALLAACKRRNIPVLSSAGAGAKADPTRLKIMDISESSIDPLARSVRHRLRKDHGIEDDVPILLSTEKPRCGLIFVPEEDGAAGANPLDYQIVPNFRIRTIPVLGTIPAIFGLAAASYILCQLAGAPFVPEPTYRIPVKAIQTQYDRLESREIDRFGSLEGMQVDVQEVEILVKELWRGISARATRLPPTDQALTRQLGNMVLTRWDPHSNATVDNLVLLTREEADEHDAMVAVDGGLDRIRQEEPEYWAKVERVLARARDEFKYAYLL